MDLNAKLRSQGHVWNHQRVRRIYCMLKLNFRHKGKQRLPVRNPAPLATLEHQTKVGRLILCTMR
jgi:putative transposase